MSAQNVNRHFPAVALLAFLVLAYLAPTLPGFSTGVRLGSDITNQYLPSLHLLRTALRHGCIPLWNPYSFSGTPFIANMQRSALFYPATALYCLFPVEKAIPWVEALHLFLAAAGMYFLLFFYTQNRAAALFAAIGWTFGGFFANRILMGHLPQLEVSAYLPLLVLLLERMLRAAERVSLAGVWLGLVGALCVFAGYPETLFMIGVVLGLRFAVELICRLRDRGRDDLIQPTAATLVANGAVALVVAGGLTAVQMLPQFELIGLSARVHSTYAIARGRSMPPMNLATLALPDFLGGIARRNAVQGSPIGEMSAYCGVATLIFALAAPILRTLRDRIACFYIGLSLIAILLSLGGGTPLYHIAFALPGFRQIAAPMRWVYLLAFALPVLAGMSLHSLLDLRILDRERLRRVFWMAIGIAGLGVAATLAYLVLRARVEHHFADLIRARYPGDAQRRLAKLPAFCEEQIAGLCAFSVLAVCTAALLFWRRRSLTTRKGRGFAVSLIAVLLLDLAGFNLKDIQAVPAMTRSLLAGGDFRALAAHAEAIDPEYRVLPLPDADAYPDQNLLIGTSSAVGYDPIELLAYRRTLDAWEALPDGQIDSRAPLLKNWRSPLAERWAVRYLISQAPLAGPELQPIAREDDIWVYRKEHSDPRAYIVHRVEKAAGESEVLSRLKGGDGGFLAGIALMDGAESAPAALAGTGPAEPVALRQPDPNHLVIEGVSTGDGLVVVADSDCPGWKAHVDGRKAAVLRINAGMRGVFVASGKHRIEMSYEPASLTIGACISGAALVIILAGVWVLSRINSRRAAKAPP